MFAGFNELMKRQEPEFRGAQVGALKVCERNQEEREGEGGRGRRGGEEEKGSGREGGRREEKGGEGERARLWFSCQIFFSLFLVFFFRILDV